MKVLIAAYHPVERLWLEQHIRDAGHSVVACASVQNALEHYRQTFYPLIILDLDLPGLKIVEFCRWIRSLAPQSHSTILGITEKKNPERLRAAVEAGIEDYLLKPLDATFFSLRFTILERWIKHGQALEVLLRAQRYAGNIIESSLDMIIAVDTERRIIEFNKAAQNVFGYRLEEVLGKHVDLLYANQEEAYTIAHLTFEQGRCVREIWNKRKNGDIFPSFLAASVLRDTCGNPVGLMGISRDITERKRAQQALQQAHAALASQHEQLMQASRLKDEFLSAVSHELRTPLTAILCQTELLLEEIYGTLDEKQQTAIESIDTSGQELLDLINDILDFSKLNQQQLTLNRSAIDVQTLCRSSLQTIARMAREKQVHLFSQVDPQVTTLHADEDRLQQVLFHLLDNAVKFTPNGGNVGLEVRGDTARQRLLFSVWDTGIGITDDDQDRMFQPFIQLDSSLSREYVGAGLGLSMVFQIVHLHGGNISVDSKVGEGSRFTVALPWTPATAFLSEQNST